MKNYILNIALLSFAVLFITSCKKEVDSNNDNNGSGNLVVDPIVLFSSISENDTILSGANLTVAGSITHNAEMHGYQIIIHNHTSMTDVFENDYHVHGESLTFNENWTNNVSDTSEMMVKVVVAKDDLGNTFTKTINVVCLP